jgi:hypothetical protein
LISGGTFTGREILATIAHAADLQTITEQSITLSIVSTATLRAMAAWDNPTRVNSGSLFDRRVEK